MSELDKLEQYLKEHHISFRRIDKWEELDNYGTILTFPRHQIVVPADGIEWDVICNRGSFGYEEGLLEGYGSIFDDAEGFLTADDVIRRIEEGGKWHS